MTVTSTAAAAEAAPRDTSEPVAHAPSTAPAVATPVRSRGRRRRAASETTDRFLLLALAPCPGEKILDVDCGTGRRLTRLQRAGSSSVGIEASLSALRQARRKVPEGAVLQCEKETGLPFLSSHFDAVVCAPLTGEHLERMHAVLREMWRVLRPGGRVVLALHYPLPAGDTKNAPMQEQLVEMDFELRAGAFRHSVKDYVAALRAAGFYDIRQHQSGRPGRQQSLFPELAEPVAPEEYPVQVVLQAFRPK